MTTPARFPRVAGVNVTARLTGQETGHLSGAAVVRNATSGGAQVGAHGGEGQELTALVSVPGVHLQQALVGGEVSEKAGLDLVCAVHLTHIDEGREGVDLLPHVASTEHVARVARAASRRRAEERHALLGVAGEAWVVPGDLWTAGVFLVCRLSFRIHARVGFEVTSMGKQGSVCSQLFSQSMPLLKERMTGE